MPNFGQTQTQGLLLVLFICLKDLLFNSSYNKYVITGANYKSPLVVALEISY